MPINPKITKPTRLIRKAIGLTQIEMAAELGITKDAVEKLENGRMKMPRALAYKYRAITGCDLRPGKENEGPVEICASRRGKCYSWEEYEAHKQELDDTNESALPSLVKSADAIVRLLFKAAHAAGKLPEMRLQFEQSVTEAVRTLQLEEAVTQTEKAAVQTERADNQGEIGIFLGGEVLAPPQRQPEANLNIWKILGDVRDAWNIPLSTLGKEVVKSGKEEAKNSEEERT